MDEGGKEVAVKTIDTYMKRPTIANEVKFLRSQNHPNVVKMLDHFISDGYLCIVIDIALGNLEDLIRSMKLF
jgi:serine/threonine protein kinase